jgi:hypothetical protein
VDQNGKLGGYDVSQGSPLLFATEDNTVILLTFGQEVSPVFTTSVYSTDGGATWAQLTFKDQAGRQIDPLAASTDGHLLAGVYHDRPQTIAYATDHGARGNWKAAPTLPGSVVGLTQLAITNDGTLFATSGTASDANPPDTHIYELAPGASSWTIPVSLPENGYLFFVQEDASGHPVALWATGTSAGTGVSQAASLYVHRL